MGFYAGSDKGIVQLGNKVLDFSEEGAEIREGLPPQFVEETAYKCSEKILDDPFFEDGVFEEAAQLCHENVRNETEFEVEANPRRDRARLEVNTFRLKNRFPSSKEHIFLHPKFRIVIPTWKDRLEGGKSTYHETVHLYCKSVEEVSDTFSFMEAFEGVEDHPLLKQSRREAQREVTEECREAIENPRQYFKHHEVDPEDIETAEDLENALFEELYREKFVEKLSNYYFDRSPAESYRN